MVLAFATAHAEALFGRVDVAAVGTDVNVFACAGTAQTVRGAVGDVREGGKAGGVWLDAVNGNLGGALRAGCVDVLLFNPPYVPSEDVPSPPEPPMEDQAEGKAPLSKHAMFERDSKCLALATDGGVDGMEVTNQLLEQIPSVLSPRGIAYVLLCAQNRPEEVKQRIRGWGDGNEWEVETVHESGKQAGWEKLQIIRIARVMR